MLWVPSCAILCCMSFFSCSVTQNSMRIGLVRSAIKTLPSIYNGHYSAHWEESPQIFCFSFHHTTDIFSAFVHRYAKISIKNALSVFLETRAHWRYVYKILENSKHIRCPYTPEKWAFQPYSRYAHFLFWESPKPLIYELEILSELCGKTIDFIR